MATGFMYSSHGNTNRGKSKKKTLNDYNLYLKEISSQSEDNVETESLISLRDEDADLSSFGGNNKLLDDSLIDAFFRPQLRLDSPTIQYPLLVTEEKEEKKSCNCGQENDDGADGSCSSSNGIEVQEVQKNVKTTRLTDSGFYFVADDMESKGESLQGQVFSDLTTQRRKSKEEQRQSENGDVLLLRVGKEIKENVKSDIDDEKERRRGEEIKRRNNKRFRTKKKNTFVKDKEREEDETDHLIQSNNSERNILLHRNNISAVLTHQTSSTLNSPHKKEHSKFSSSNHNNKRKRKSFGGFRKKSMEEGSTSTHAHSKSDDDEECVSDFISSQHQQTIRADQFNKICPSPFDDVPGFRRSNTMQHRKSERDSSGAAEIPKSLSFDANNLSSSNIPAPIVLGRDKWIQFEEDRGATPFQEAESETSPSIQSSQKPDLDFFPELTSETDQMIVDEANENEIDLGINENSEDDSRTLKEQWATGGVVAKSLENLLETVNKTVTLLKGSITKREASEPDENRDLVNSDTRDDLSSDISDEIISLEFDTDEEKFRDTPVKQFPDVSLFQVSVVGTNHNDLRIERNSISYTMKVDNGSNDVLDEYPPVTQRNSWKFWYRYPDKKMKLGRRKWTPIIAHVENNFLKINSLNGCVPEIKREFPLHSFCSFTTPAMHKGNKDGKVHSVKLQYVKYKEIRRVKPRLGVEHVPVFTPVVKLSCRDLIALRDFMKRVESVIRQIPTYRDEDISYEREEIFIDSEDNCSYLISGRDGVVLKYNITVQLKLRCFISGNPELKLFLNDVNNKDILSRTKEALSKENKQTNKWIVPESYEFNPCIDVKKSQDEGGVVFTPPDGYSFELLRFRLRKRNPVPIVVTSSLEVLALKSVHLKAEVRVHGDGKSIRYKRNNVILYIPVPSSWSKLFIKSRPVGRILKYLSVKSSLKSQRVSRASNARATFEISTGSARYEPAYGAIIWELGSLPIIRGSLPADTTHTFQCFIELPFPLHIRDDFQPYSYLEFNVKQQMGSNVSVEEVLLSDGRVPEKWVCYRSNFIYRIEMRILEDGKERT